MTQMTGAQAIIKSLRVNGVDTVFALPGGQLDHLFDAGFLMINTCTATLSTPMGEQGVDALVAAMADGFEKLKAL